jgi:hypothetical protein
MCRKRSFLVGGKDQRKRNGKAERSGGLEIDHQLETRGLPDRQIGGFFALQDFICVNGSFHPDRRMAPAETRMPVPDSATRTVAARPASDGIQQ